MKHYKAPRALVCGLLEKDGKGLFLTRKDQGGLERIELPWIYGTIAADPVGAIGEAFRKQTSVKVHAERIIYEGKEDIGDEGMPDIVPVLVFSMIPGRKPMEEPVPSREYSGFLWLTLDEARERPLGRHARWLAGEILSI